MDRDIKPGTDDIPEMEPTPAIARGSLHDTMMGQRHMGWQNHADER